MAARVILVCALAALAAASGSRVVLTETIPPKGWTVGVRPAPSTVVPFMVALKQRNLDRLDKIFEAVSDPTSLQYGEYLTNEQVRALVAPQPASVAAVLAAMAPAQCVSTGDALKCTASVAQIEAVFETELRFVQHTESGLTLIRQLGNFSVPAHVAGDVEFVSPLSMYANPFRTPKRTLAAQAGAAFVVPETITRMYNITLTGDSRASQGVAEFGAANWNYTDGDLQTFARETGTTIAFTESFGPDTPPGMEISVEASLDVQYIAAIGQGNTNWYWKEEQWMFDFVQNLQNATSRPNVLSLSYAWSEEEQCIGLTDQANCQKLKLNNAQYVARINTEFQKLGSQGLSIFVASGDSGCHGRTDEECALAAGKKMYPDFPAASPFVTSVGGTALTNAVSQNPTEPICKQLTCATGGTEVTATTEKQVAEISSGGGFSNFAPRPPYQTAVVAQYLQKYSKNLPPTKLFNSTNRGFPDVSALSHNYYIEYSGQATGVDGTSCASPVWAGIAALLNAHRLRNGRPIIGFANYLLYQIYNVTGGAAFQDVTVGDNRCTEEGCSCKYGFTAEPGWDAATGLGTPNVGRIVAAMDTIDAAREARKRMM